MPDSDYYDILGVGRDADLSAIKKAYRRAAVRHHPDKNPGDPEAEDKFKSAAAAYAVLSDPAKRQLYDRYGKAGLGAQGAGGGGYGPPGERDREAIASDIAEGDVTPEGAMRDYGYGEEKQ